VVDQQPPGREAIDITQIAPRRSFFRETLQLLGIRLALDGSDLWYFPTRPVRPSLLQQMRERRAELMADLLLQRNKGGHREGSNEPPFCCPQCDGIHFVRRAHSRDGWSCARCQPPDLPVGDVEWRVSPGMGGGRV